MRINKKEFLRALPFAITFEKTIIALPQAPQENTANVQETNTEATKNPDQNNVNQEASTTSSNNEEPSCETDTSVNNKEKEEKLNTEQITAQIDLQKLATILLLSQDKYIRRFKQNAYGSHYLKETVEKHKKEHYIGWPSVLSLLSGPAEIKGRLAIFKFKENTRLTYDTAFERTFREDIMSQAHSAEIIIFNFRNVNNVDSSTLETLHYFGQSLQTSNKYLVYIDVPHSIKERFRYKNYEFLVCETLEEAVNFVEAKKIRKYRISS